MKAAHLFDALIGKTPVRFYGPTEHMKLVSWIEKNMPSLDKLLIAAPNALACRNILDAVTGLTTPDNEEIDVSCARYLEALKKMKEEGQIAQ